MPSYNAIVRRVIEESDVVLIVVDIRSAMDVDLSMLINEIRRRGKRYLYVLNKVDLFEGDIKDIALTPFIAVSATEHLSTSRLVRKIMAIGKGGDLRVGVVGLPNAGKSSLINALKGRGAASTSPISGHTKGVQHIRISKSILLIDTPGVLTAQDPIARLKAGAIDADKIKAIEPAAAELIEALDGIIEAHYGVAPSEDPYETLEAIGEARNLKRSGGAVDTDRTARMVVRDWQKGSIRS